MLAINGIEFARRPEHAMRTFLTFVVLMVFGMAVPKSGWAQLHEHDPLERPNIVVVLADDMGIGDTSAYQDWTRNSDHAQLHTPAMDRLARTGVRFTDAHSPSSRCSPTRYALLTGRYCWRTHLKQWVLFGVHTNPLIERERVTLPEYLQGSGYRTGMVGKWHLGLTYHNDHGGLAAGWDDADLSEPIADGPLDHGFDFFHGMSRSHGTSGPNGSAGSDPDQARGPGWIHNRNIVGATGRGKALDGSYKYDEVGNVIDAQAFQFLDQANSDQTPFFLYFASPSNHAPYTPSTSIDGTPIAGASQLVDGTLTKNKRLDFIYQNDVHVARLLDYLQERSDPRRPGQRLIDNTLFIFSSDNGAERNNKQFTGPLRSNKGSTYEGGHRVPFLVSWPAGGIGDGDAQTPGRSCERLVALTDLFATVASIIDRPLPELSGDAYGAEDSVSQLAAMRGESFPPRIPVFPNDHAEASKEVGDLRAWVAVRSNAAPLPGQWKLFLDEAYAFDRGLHPKELYNLANDQTESINLIDDPRFQSVTEFLLEQARLAGGDKGSSRQLQE